MLAIPSNVHDLTAHYSAIRKRLRGRPVPTARPIAVAPVAVEPPKERILNTVAEVMRELGGTGAITKITARNSTSTSRRWRREGLFPADTFDAITNALKERGVTAPPSLWSIPAITDSAVVVEFSPAICRPTVIGIRYPAVQDIVLVVCRFYGASYHDVISERRTWPLVRPRQIAMYLAKELTLNSYPRIGTALGGRDHTTVMHGHRKIERQLLTDERLADEVQLLRMKIGDHIRLLNEPAVEVAS